MKWMRMRPGDEAGVTRLIQHIFFFLLMLEGFLLFNITHLLIYKNKPCPLLSRRVPSLSSAPLFFLYRCETLRCAFEKKKKENPKSCYIINC